MQNSLKQRLHQVCVDQLKTRIVQLEKAIKDAQEAASDDTKSSSGDQFESSREMLAMEVDKNDAQLSQVTNLLKRIHNLKPSQKMDKVGFGSLVHTNEGIYYFSVSLGKVSIEDDTFFALSLVSPIGQALEGRKAGEKVTFMGREVVIEAIG